MKAILFAPANKAILCLLIVFCSEFAWSDAANEIRQVFEGANAIGATYVGNRKLEHQTLVHSIYQARDHQPLWLANAPLDHQAKNLLTAIAESTAHGFNSERYHYSEIENLVQSTQRNGIALELLLTDAFVGQALHRGQGSVAPPSLDPEWQLPAPEVDAVGLLMQTIKNQTPVNDVLANLWPNADEYRRLQQRRVEVAATGDTRSESLPQGSILRRGDVNDRIALLKARLMGPGDYTEIFDEDLHREVIAYQRASGLEADGLVGTNTIEALNETAVNWIDRLDANLERWRWLPRQTPSTYIRVNIASYRLNIIEDNNHVFGMNVIVGKPYRRTPVFTESIKYFVVHPYWNVPFSIATKDKLPLLQKDASSEAAKGFEAKPVSQQEFIAVDAIDWSAVSKKNFNYLLRQRPGEQNALGKIKFMLPNPHAVYLHDTPNRELFAKQERSFSSGCVRVEKPIELAQWLLKRDKHLLSQQLEAYLAKGETQTIYLKKPVPTYIVYFTAFVDDDNEVTFRRDIYGRDKSLVAALRDTKQ